MVWVRGLQWRENAANAVCLGNKKEQNAFEEYYITIAFCVHTGGKMVKVLIFLLCLSHCLNFLRLVFLSLMRICNSEHKRPFVFFIFPQFDVHIYVMLHRSMCYP